MTERKSSLNVSPPHDFAVPSETHLLIYSLWVFICETRTPLIRRKTVSPLFKQSPMKCKYKHEPLLHISAPKEFTYIVKLNTKQSKIKISFLRPQRLHGDCRILTPQIIQIKVSNTAPLKTAAALFECHGC